MPDGDRFHNGITRRYQNAYRVLCDARTPLAVVEPILLRAIKKELQKRGDALVEHVAKVTAVMDNALAEAGFDVIAGCITASERADALRYDTRLSPRDGDLVCNAAKRYLHDVRYGKEPAAVIDGARLLERTFQLIYRSEFEEPVANKRDHHGGADPAMISGRLEEVRPTLDRTLAAWAARAIARGSTSGLQLPRRTDVAAVSLDENLL